jgi:DTW domain-containing protein YfiP
MCGELDALRAGLPAGPEILILRHTIEAGKPSGTARLAALALPGVTLIDHGARGVVTPPMPAGAALLWPEAGRALPGLPRALVVVDGSWAQARRMVQRAHGLATMPRLVLAAPAAPGPRLRRARTPAQMSTAESLAAALAFLGHEVLARALRGALAEFVTRAIPATPRQPVSVVQAPHEPGREPDHR